MQIRESQTHVDGLAALPWWAGVVAGLVASFIVGFAIPRIVSPDAFLDIWHATLPLAAALLVTGVLFSAATLMRRRLLKLTSLRSHSLGPVLKLSLPEFSHRLAEGFTRRGYSVVENGEGAAHLGVDLVFLKDGRMYFVQCKHWRTFQIDAQPLKELRALMNTNDVAGGYFVTAGVFTREARTFAAAANIELIGGSQLLAFLHTNQAHEAISPLPEPVFISSTALTVPVCPSCRSPMTRRVAKYGKNAGEEFWGCPGYPKCKGVREANDLMV